LVGRGGRESVWQGGGEPGEADAFPGMHREEENEESVDWLQTCDWSTCSLDGTNFHKIEDPNGVDFKIVVRGELTVFYFSKKMPTSGSGTGSGTGTGTGKGEGSNSNPVKYGPHISFLTRVEYTIALSPSQTLLTLPVHLYGELAKTDAGCELLVSHKVVTELKEIVVSAQKDKNKNKKHEEDYTGAMWALAHICAAPPGLDLVSRNYPDFIPHVCKQAYESGDYSMRGTCCLLLGLVSATFEGRSRIHEGKNWTCLGGGIVVPKSLKLFFKDFDDDESSTAQHSNNNPTKNVVLQNLGQKAKGKGKGKEKEKGDAVAVAALEALAKCGDSITQKEALGTLQKLKNDKANSAIWKEESFVRTVHSMLEGYSYDLDVRKFVLFELLN